MLFIFHYIFLRLAKQSQFIPLQNVVYFITLPFSVRKIFTFYTNDVLLLNVQFQGQRVKMLTALQKRQQNCGLHLTCDGGLNCYHSRVEIPAVSL